MKLPSTFPTFAVRRRGFEEIITLVRAIEDFRNKVVEAVNYNNVVVYSQDAQPTGLLSGQVALWKDTDATSGQPTHYLMASDGTDIVTFASEETVP